MRIQPSAVLRNARAGQTRRRPAARRSGSTAHCGRRPPRAPGPGSPPRRGRRAAGRRRRRLAAPWRPRPPPRRRPASVTGKCLDAPVTSMDGAAGDVDSPAISSAQARARASGSGSVGGAITEACHGPLATLEPRGPVIACRRGPRRPPGGPAAYRLPLAVWAPPTRAIPGPATTLSAMEKTSLRVGLLGCGHVGGALVRLLVDDGDRIAARTGLQLELAAVAVRSRYRERDAPVPDGILTTDAGCGRGRSHRRCGRRGHRRDRAGAQPDPDGAQVRQAGRHRQQGAAGQLRSGAVRGGLTRRRRPVVRVGGRRRYSPDPPASRITGRRTHPPDHGHRQRDDQLHPQPNDRIFGELSRRPG